MENTEQSEKKVRLNGTLLSEAQFQEKKSELEKKSGVSVVKIGENQYKTKIKG